MPKLMIILLCITIPIHWGFSQTVGFSSKNVVSGKIGSPEQVVLEDIDLDQDLDVVFFSSTQVGWFENREGNFSHHKVHLLFEDHPDLRPDAFYITDLDQDGDPDIITLTSYGQYDQKVIGWHENLLEGQQFSERQIILSHDDYHSGATVSDYDGDGDLDLIVALNYQGGLQLIENIADCTTWGEPILIPGSDQTSIQNIDASDVDNDGDQDLITQEYYGTDIIYLYEQTSSAPPTYRRIFLIGGFDWIFDIQCTDLNLDGLSDVVFASSEFVGWVENMNPDTIWSWHALENSLGSRAVSSGFVDGDVYPDIVFAEYRSNNLNWMRGESETGIFADPINLGSEPHGFGPSQLGDLDQDGDQDLIAVANWAGKIIHFENEDGAGGFDEGMSMSSITRGAWSVYPADLDGDGDLDLLSASDGDDKIAWYENLDGHGTYGMQQIISNEAQSARFVVAADFDGDTDLDVLAAIRGTQTVAWFQNVDGQGTFGEAHIISAQVEGVVCAISADLDQDGDQDVLSAGWEDGKIEWYENVDGLGTFGAANFLSETYRPRHLSTADLDGDGDFEVLVASEYGNTIYWQENLDGSHDFGAVQVISDLTNGAYGTATADIDNDGDLDVLSASWRDGKIAWYENMDGSGSFGPQNVINTGLLGASSVSSGDFDNDGDLDIVSTCSGHNKIYWNENMDGLGTFSEPYILAQNLTHPKQGLIADIDRDGDQDVIATAENQIVWFMNTWITGIEDSKSGEINPQGFSLLSCFPNPFNSQTAIQYTLYQPSDVTINIYDLSGSLVWSRHFGIVPTGNHQLHWLTHNNRGERVNSGVYIIHLTTQYGNCSIKSVLLK